MTAALYQRRGTVCVLDDDEAYLEALAMVLPAAWSVRFFSRVDDCLNEIQQEPPRWHADLFTQSQIVERWRQGQPLLASIWQYWQDCPERLDFTRFAVFDYAMPKMNGVDAFQELADYQGVRILLTGQADERVAVRAFNEGFIDQYVPKQTDQLTRYLIETLTRMDRMPVAAHDEIWRATLDAQQLALLRHPSVRAGINELVQARGFVEHLIVGQPFGMLACDAQAAVWWLQIETPRTLGALIELAQGEGCSSAWIDQMIQGQALVDMELRDAMSPGAAPSYGIHDCFELARDPRVLAALIPLGDRWQLPDAQTAKGHSMRHGARKVRG